MCTLVHVSRALGVHIGTLDNNVCVYDGRVILLFHMPSVCVNCLHISPDKRGLSA